MYCNSNSIKINLIKFLTFKGEPKMSEIQIVEIYGIKIESRCAALLEIVMKFGSSSYSNQQNNAVMAIKKLGEYGCTKALSHIVQHFGSSSYSSQQNMARKALEHI